MTNVNTNNNKQTTDYIMNHIEAKCNVKVEEETKEKEEEEEESLSKFLLDAVAAGIINHDTASRLTHHFIKSRQGSTTTSKDTKQVSEEEKEEEEEEEEEVVKEEEEEEEVVKEEEKEEEEHISPFNIYVRNIGKEKKKEEDNNIWENSRFESIRKLQKNNVGIVGEKSINDICKQCGIDAYCNGAKTKQRGGGEGDGKVMGKSVEIKTAHLGSSQPTFQHELTEKPWETAKYMIFNDIAPEHIYLTIFENFDEATYKSRKKLPYCFPTKKATQRHEIGAYKLDTTIKINEGNVKNGYTIKITEKTSLDEIKSFLLSRFC
jgi:hypothetical protein